MYVNYGDKDFFEHGVLVDAKQVLNIMYCMPICDSDGEYVFAECEVDITDSWIDRKAVMDFIGMTEKTFDNIQFAIGCIDFYGVENFSSPYEGYVHDKEYICDVLKHRTVASDHLNIEW